MLLDNFSTIIFCINFVILLKSSEAKLSLVSCYYFIISNLPQVVEIRISIKGQQQSKLSPAGQKVPNFGFVVFADEEAARLCLDSVPIHLPDGHRLNVETKKNKVNMKEAR